MSSNEIPCLRCPCFPIVPSVAALEAHGVTRRVLSDLTGASRSAISRWAKNGIPPWHHDSVRRLWIQIQHNQGQVSVIGGKEAESYDDL